MAKKKTQYSKTHASKKAATSHARKIKARGGKSKVTNAGEKYKIEYSF